MFEVGIIPVFQGLATAIAAVGSGVLLAGFMTGHADGQGGLCTYMQQALLALK